jgi:predicted RNA binding protein YcfA (HicA-like mRNA interferase family)
MAFKANVWSQLKNLTKGEFISALERDGWQEEVTGGGSERLFLKANPDGTHRRIAIHFHHAKEPWPAACLPLCWKIPAGWTTTSSG